MRILLRKSCLVSIVVWVEMADFWTGTGLIDSVWPQRQVVIMERKKSVVKKVKKGPEGGTENEEIGRAGKYSHTLCMLTVPQFSPSSAAVHQYPLPAP